MKIEAMAQQDNDYIIFEGIDKKAFDGIGKNNKQAVPKRPIKGYYDSLYDELYEKCNPVRFLDPYDKEKIEQANDIFSQLHDPSIKTDLSKLKELRSKAIKGLGILFCTETLYERLIENCHPRNFSAEYYDAQRLSEANIIYDEILKNADNIEVLEDCEIRATELIALVEKRVLKEKEKQEEENEKIRIRNLRLRIEEYPSEINGMKIITAFCGLAQLPLIYVSITESEYMFIFVFGLFIIQVILIFEIDKARKESEELKKQLDKMIKK